MRLTLLILLAFALSISNKQNNPFYMSVEWEQQDAVWFGWADGSSQFRPVVVNLIKTLMPHVIV